MDPELASFLSSSFCLSNCLYCPTLTKAATSSNPTNTQCGHANLNRIDCTIIMKFYQCRYISYGYISANQSNTCSECRLAETAGVHWLRNEGRVGGGEVMEEEVKGLEGEEEVEG